MRSALVLTAVGIVLAAGCGGSEPDGGAVAPAADPVREIAALEDFTAAFDDDEGTARLLLILSPT